MGILEMKPIYLKLEFLQGENWSIQGLWVNEKHGNVIFAPNHLKCSVNNFTSLQVCIKVIFSTKSGIAGTKTHFVDLLQILFAQDQLLSKYLNHLKRAISASLLKVKTVN